ncbi:Outer membrane lipoprotein omp16 precursor [hydrothermal vent metagenome]|uniref:Outer membrane lipoprotein omp16 n=1 Tax=hydrothermal vent metagenome TaxID=652676 RepID=A0A3B0TSU9_9ZZZZ
MRGGNRYLLVFILFLSGIQAFPQNGRRNQKLLEKAGEAYHAGKNSLAIGTAKKILAGDSLYTEAHLFLADIYHSLDSLYLEIGHLKSALRDSGSFSPLLYYRLGEASFSLGDYKEALDAYLECDKLSGSGSKRKAVLGDKIQQCRFSLQSINNPVSLPVKALGNGVNTPLNEYWPSLTIDGATLVFNRLVGDSTRGGFRQEDFYSSKKVNGVWQEAVPLSEINTSENEGAQSMSANGKLLFFSACNRIDGLGSCDIYFSRFMNGKWQKPVNAGPPVNSRDWESLPSVSANANYLYFTSNRKGGKGEMDIWRCRLYGFNSRGLPEWGNPENLGDSINTKGDELSPFIHFDGKTLYFSSDGWIGMGGKDIFYSQMKGDGSWTTPVNMGYPINSYNDEQGFVVDATGKTAYFSTNREKSNGLDIYSSVLGEGFQPGPVTYVKGVVLDKDTNKPVKADIDLVDIGEKKYLVQDISTGPEGEFLICLPLGNKYAFNVLKKGYLFHSESFELSNVHSATNPIELKIYLQHIRKGLNMVLRNIYFETDSFRLLPESMPEMDKLIRFLNINPSIVIEIGGHTDKSGTAEYNQTLSEKRAKEVYKYLVAKGISKGRLTYKGYGFSKPASSTGTSYEYWLNRRTEIKIIGIR